MYIHIHSASKEFLPREPMVKDFFCRELLFDQLDDKRDGLDDLQNKEFMSGSVLDSVNFLKQVLGTCRLRVSYVSVTCQLHVSYMSVTCQLRFRYMSVTCQLHVSYMSWAACSTWSTLSRRLLSCSLPYIYCLLVLLTVYTLFIGALYRIYIVYWCPLPYILFIGALDRIYIVCWCS
jgi:hypothetical protein